MLYSTTEVAKMVELPTAVVSNAASTGTIPAIKFGNTWRYADKHIGLIKEWAKKYKAKKTTPTIKKWGGDKKKKEKNILKPVETLERLRVQGRMITDWINYGWIEVPNIPQNELYKKTLKNRDCYVYEEDLAKALHRSGIVTLTKGEAARTLKISPSSMTRSFIKDLLFLHLDKQTYITTKRALGSLLGIRFDDNDELYTVKEASDLLNISRSTIITMGKNGDLLVAKLGGSIRITKKSINSFLVRNNITFDDLSPSAKREKQTVEKQLSIDDIGEDFGSEGKNTMVVKSGNKWGTMNF